MATIIDFSELQTRCQKSRRLSEPLELTPAATAQLFLFTGVRYERVADPARAQKTRRRSERKAAQRRAQD